MRYIWRGSTVLCSHCTSLVDVQSTWSFCLHCFILCVLAVLCSRVLCKLHLLLHNSLLCKTSVFWCKQCSVLVFSMYQACKSSGKEAVAVSVFASSESQQGSMLTSSTKPSLWVMLTLQWEWAAVLLKMQCGNCSVSTWWPVKYNTGGPTGICSA